MTRSIEELREMVRKRPSELRELKEKGKKIIGFLPGGFIPQEILNSSEGVPVGWIRGGDPEPVMFSATYVPRWIDTYCRSQIGYKDTEEDIYHLTDILVVPIVDASTRAVGDIYDVYTDIDIIRVGYPHLEGKAPENWYLKELNILVKKLEELTGSEIGEERLKDEIIGYKGIDSLIKEISLMRKSDQVISGRDFAFLNFSSFILEKDVFRDFLRSFIDGLKKAGSSKVPDKRVLLIGPSITMGDYKVYDLLKKFGAEVVIEDFAFGIRPYWEDIKVDAGPIRALAEKYLQKKIPTAFTRSSERRIDGLIELAKEFKVDGIVYYTPMYQDAYQTQLYYLDRILREELDLPTLSLETDYDIMEIGPMETRIETFVEAMGGS